MKRAYPKNECCLILEGGGVKCAYQYGVLKTFVELFGSVEEAVDAFLGGQGLGGVAGSSFGALNSAMLLAEAARRVAEAGWSIVNIDSTIVAQAPKLAPHMGAIVARIAGVLGLEVHQVNVKAKTAERLGPVGQGQCIEARAAALLCRNDCHGI